MEMRRPHRPESRHPQTERTDDAERFVQLLLEHEPRVRAFLRGLLPTWEDVDDVLQESGLVAWRKFAEFEEGTAFGGWFLTIARYEALTHRRKLAKTPMVFTEEVWDRIAEDALEADTSKAYRQHLQACLQNMTPDKRELILRVHSPGVVTRDVASQFGKSEQAFYKMIQRLRTVLVNCVAKRIAAENVA